MHRCGISFQRRGLFLKQAPEARDWQYLDLLQVHHIHPIPTGIDKCRSLRRPQRLTDNFTPTWLIFLSMFPLTAMKWRKC